MERKDVQVAVGEEQVRRHVDVVEEVEAYYMSFQFVDLYRVSSG